jgi:hypothetical protein
MTRASALVFATAGWLAVTTAAAGGAPGDYPLMRELEARVKIGDTSITSKVTVGVDRLMEENRLKRVTDALKHGGYPNFFTALRMLPPIGWVEVNKRRVELRYAREDQRPSGRRLILVADKPLFFLGDPAKAKPGFELTVVELNIDAKGAITGSMAGAARVKPSLEGDVLLEDYAEALVTLSSLSR